MRDIGNHFGRWCAAIRLYLLRSTLTCELRPPTTHLVSRITSSVFVWCFSLTAAEIDETRLPPPAKVEVDFVRDIKPILETSCLRCHGPEKPKGRYRLDNRESALKGGLNGIDIIPGDSAKSPLIHNVARLVEDMEMPPPGKGDPLTPEQIGLLRAWIDQGAHWPEGLSAEKMSFVFAPTLRWISVDGDAKSFRENEGIREGWTAGIEHFALKEQLSIDRTFTAEGRALFQDEDYQLKLKLQKTDVGFIGGGFEQWRRYYDDTGGYYRPFSTPSYDLDRDLHLDIGRAWIDFGLSLPNWPQMVLGYEYQYRQGSKSTLEWGEVNGKNIYPAFKDIDEHTHILKFDLSHEFHDWRLENNARVEFYDSNTRLNNANPFTLGPGPDSFAKIREGFQHTQGMNASRLEKQVTDWLFLSGGYLYSKFDGDASFNRTTVDAAGVPIAGNVWYSDQIVLDRETHIFSLSSMTMPWEGLTFSAGLQSEWMHQEGFGKTYLDEGDPNLPQMPLQMESDYDQNKLSENASLKFTKIPWTVLFAEARLAQDQIDQYEQTGPNGAGSAFDRKTDYSNDLQVYRAGLNTSPLRWLSLSAHYKYRDSDSDYNNTQRTAPEEGYPAFIRSRDIVGDEAQTKLVVKPVNWLKTTLTYKHVDTDYHTTTEPFADGSYPGGEILAGQYRANIYSLNTALTPIQRLYLSTTFSYSDTRTATAANDDPSIVPYQGDVYTVISSARFALNKSTDLHAAYSFSQADYGQNNYEGLPLGVEYTRQGVMLGVTKRLSANVSTNLRYSYYRYNEPSSGGVNDYTAHGVFATVMMKCP
jgi:opacity protein-like surface antigen